MITLAILAVEREATTAWTLHKEDCLVRERASWRRRYTCGLEVAENLSLALRRRLVPPAPPPDLRRRTKGPA